VAVADPTDPNMERPSCSRGDPNAGARVLQLHAEKAPVAPAHLFDVGAVTVQDIMVAARRIRGHQARRRLGDISHHSPPATTCAALFRDALGEVLGVAHLRKVLACAHPASSTAGAGAASPSRPTRALDHAGAGAAAVLPGKQGARRAGGTIRRADGPGHARGHHRGDIGKFTTPRCRRPAPSSPGTSGTPLRKGAMPVATSPGRWSQSADRRTEDLNGLIVAYLQDIPEAGRCGQIGSVRWKSCTPRADG